MALSDLKSGWKFAIRLAGTTGALVFLMGLLTALTLSSTEHKMLGTGLAVAGGVIVVALIGFEIALALEHFSKQRGAFGTNALIQVLLAFALFGGINAYSFLHYERFDLTREKQFTLSEDLHEQLTRLSSDAPTTIVLHLIRQSAFQSSDAPDSHRHYDAAAERKVVEKVKDMVDQIQELGPRFKVVVLDVQEENYQARYDEVTKDAPALRQAMERAPENSIFIYADGRVQRLGFDDIFQLDKQASQKANGGRGNLILFDQGIEPFAHRVLNIDERKPKVAVAVAHPVMGTRTVEETAELGMSRLRQALEDRGFEVMDLIVRKGLEEGQPEPAAYTFDEDKYQRLAALRNEMDKRIDELQAEIKELRKVIKEWESKPVKELAKTPLGKRILEDVGEKELTETLRQRVVASLKVLNLDTRETLLEKQLQERRRLDEELKEVRVENLAELRRLTDIRAKMNRLLADCDLLIIPRQTIFNLSIGFAWSNGYHHLSEEQVEAIKDFLKAGKPVLFCFGPVNEPFRFQPLPFPTGPDRLEEELKNLGVKLGRETILYDAEAAALAQSNRSIFNLNAVDVEVPPVYFDWNPKKFRLTQKEFEKEQPIRESMQVMEKSLGEHARSRFSLRHPRSVDVATEKLQELDYDPVILRTGAEAWAETEPFRDPKYDPPKDLSKEGGERRGPFPIGVAFDAELPSSWLSADEKPITTRIAVIGHGHVFGKDSFKPAQEKLLLDVCNWLLGRDDLLSRSDRRWQYPRLHLTENEIAVWQSFVPGLPISVVGLCLPVLFVYLGIVVWLVRRLR
ncbi:MAG: hypothetical protein KatS3mg105_0291 [Gemmatales bacterium]|nr:MAG: hypothetical protein KatS3mg105_0291 [Gemmatales bacterium]